MKKFFLQKATSFGEMLHQDVATAKQALAKHVQKIVLTPQETPDGPVFDVSGDVDFFFDDKDGMQDTAIPGRLLRSDDKSECSIFREGPAWDYADGVCVVCRWRSNFRSLPRLRVSATARMITSLVPTGSQVLLSQLIHELSWSVGLQNLRVIGYKPTLGLIHLPLIDGPVVVMAAVLFPPKTVHPYWELMCHLLRVLKQWKSLWSLPSIGRRVSSGMY